MIGPHGEKRPKIVARPGRCAGVVLYVRRRTDGAGRRVQFEVDKGTAEAMIRELRDAVEG